MRRLLTSDAPLAGHLVVAAACVIAALTWLPSVLDLFAPADAEVRSQRSDHAVLSGTTALETRPLFHVSRRSSRPDRPVTTAAAGGSFEERYLLRGVAMGDGDPVGIFEQAGTGLWARMRIGQMVEGYRLMAIEPGLARFETDNGQRASLTRRSAP